ncbi:MAG: ribosome maturation factor RimP [Candidatus Omnitrophica bacterium]|jgi:ribosome maturation factor RimP|nr:ribosome maturation factor RimP [Candidatus Omnitrophota bacterium]
MINESLVSQVKALIGDFLSSRGLELVELILRPEGSGTVVRVLADYPHGGITLGECASLNRGIGDMLEEKNLFESHYVLEVCSPGLDRPLRTARDFERCKSNAVKCFLKEPINGKIEIDGVVSDVKESRLILETKQGIAEIPVEKINKAKRIVL